MRLLRWIVLRRFGEERLRSLLVVLGVALGVAVFVGIRLASQSALASFSHGVDAVAGRANLEVTAGSDGFDERVFAAVAGEPGVRAAAPSIDVHVRAHAGGPGALPAHARAMGVSSAAPAAATSATPTNDLTDGAARRARWPETLLLLGVDVMREAPFARYAPPPGAGGRLAATLLGAPGAAAIPAALAARTGLGVGDTLTVLASGRPSPLIVRQVLEAGPLDRDLGGSVAIVDIATAQDVLGRHGVIDRIGIIVDPGAQGAVRASLARRMPPGVSVEPPSTRTRQVENLVRAFRLNLSALSFIALFVSTTLVFNAVAMSVLRSRREIGMLRGLGVTRAGILKLFLGEGLALGVVGSLLGLALGTVFARGALHAVSRTLADLYLVRAAGAFEPDGRLYVEAFVIGIAVSLLSALLPAWEAAGTPPGVTMRQGAMIDAERPHVARWAALALALLAAAAGVARWTVRAHWPAGGFVSAALVLTGFALLSPLVTRAFAGAGAPVARRLGGIEAELGTRTLGATVARASVVIAAVAVAVGMTLSLTLMVRSFRRTVDTWITQSIRGDLYVEPYGHRESGSAAALPPAFVRAASGIPGVRGMDTLRGTRFVFRDRPVQALGVDFDAQRRFGALRFVHGEGGAILERARSRGETIVTESFASHFGLAQGDTLAFAAPSGPVRLRVAGVIYDYSTDAGVLFVDAGQFARLWHDDRTESLALYLAPGASVDAVRARLNVLAGDDLVLAITPNRALRQSALRVFDQTFQVTWALQGIAVLVAFLGVIGTLTSLVFQRGRDIAVLRAVGARRSQVRAMIVTESAWIGLIGSLLGCACGAALALILVHVVNRQFFGWTIQMAWEPWLFVQAVVLVVATASLAGVWPARFAASRVAAEAMRRE